MKAEDKYLLGVLWKFGTIKPGTNQFVFQSYDKYEQMEYIRKRLAPDKVIKVSTRKDPRSGADKTLYRLNFTNADWADKVRMYEGVNAEKIIDKEFLRGFLETKGTVGKSGKIKMFNVSLSRDEMLSFEKNINQLCDVNVKLHDVKTGYMVSYNIDNFLKIVSVFGKQNPKHWGEVLKKMNPDD